MVNDASNLWQDEEGSAAWLLQLFQEKDRLKQSFLQTGDFSAISGQPAVPCHNIQVPDLYQGDTGRYPTYFYDRKNAVEVIRRRREK